MPNPLDQLLEASEYTPGGHQLCTLAHVTIGTGKVRPALALWRLKRGPVPNTHRVMPTCDEPGCIALDHQELQPIAKPKPVRTHCSACGRPF